MTQVTAILNAFQLHNWYMFVALALTVVLQNVRKNTFPPLTALLHRLWFKIPEGWRWVVPVLTGAATAFTTAFAEGANLSGALVAVVGGIFGIGTPAMGLHAGLKESPVNIDGGPGGKPLVSGS